MIGNSSSPPPAVATEEIHLWLEGDPTTEFEPGPELLEGGDDDVTREVEIPQELLDQMAS